MKMYKDKETKLQLRLTPEQHKKLKQRALDMDMTMSELMRKTIEELVK